MAHEADWPAPVTRGVQSESRKIRFPTAFTVLAPVVLFVWIASFFVPANRSAAISRFALAVGAFIMVTTKTGAIQTGIGRLAAPWPPSWSSARFVGIAAAIG